MKYKIFTKYFQMAGIKQEKPLKPFSRRRNELSIENSCIQWGGIVVIPAQLRKKSTY